MPPKRKAPCSINIRPVEVNDLGLLADIAYRAKASWGYDEDFMRRCKGELTILPAELSQAHHYYALCQLDNKQLAGYCALRHLDRADAELDALFIAPEYFGQGCGRRLLIHALQTANTAGAKTLVVQSDPQAQAFYSRFGASLCGFSPSQSIRGRFLPMLKFQLADVLETTSIGYAKFKDFTT